MSRYPKPKPFKLSKKRYKKAPKNLKEITQEELNEKLKRHRLWAITKGKAGTYEDFTGYNFTKLSYKAAILNEADFRGSWLGETIFTKAILKKCNFSNCWVEGSTSKGAVWAGANIEGTLWAIT